MFYSKEKSKESLWIKDYFEVSWYDIAVFV